MEDTKTCLEKQPLSQEMLEKMNAYWRAANYLFSYTFFLRFNIVQYEPEFHSHTASPVRQESADEDTPSSPRSHHDHLL